MAFITKLGHLPPITGVASVFDMQGRFLGTLQEDQMQDVTVAESLRMKFKKSGIYILKQGCIVQKVNVK